MPPSECPEELSTLHHKGRWYGFGPVLNTEQVTFAVFKKTNLDGSRLTEASFDNRHLANSNQSLLRRGLVTKKTFLIEVVKTGILIGIAHAAVSKIREMRADIIQNDSSIKKVRAICVFDRVGPGDFDGHASAGYAPATTIGLSKEKVGKLRKRIRLDLAEAFSEVTDAEREDWPSRGTVLWKRVISVGRVIKSTVSCA